MVADESLQKTGLISAAQANKTLIMGSSAYGPWQQLSLYQWLQVPESASPRDIRNAYRRLAVQYHTDKVDKHPICQETAGLLFKQINAAHQLLMDPEQRQKYDQQREERRRRERMSSLGRQPTGGHSHAAATPARPTASTAAQRAAPGAQFRNWPVVSLIMRFPLASILRVYEEEDLLPTIREELDLWSIPRVGTPCSVLVPLAQVRQGLYHSSTIKMVFGTAEYAVLVHLTGDSSLTELSSVTRLFALDADARRVAQELQRRAGPRR